MASSTSSRPVLQEEESSREQGPVDVAGGAALEARLARGQAMGSLYQ